MSCIVDTCAAEVHCRGLCVTHYRRWQKTGSPEPLGAKRPGKLEREHLQEVLNWVMDGEPLTSAEERENEAEQWMTISRQR